jgi:rhamnose utilization protein RhaD (predicted bifunctional aldolase and dehydrogenase)
MSVEDLAGLSRYYGADPDYVLAGGGNTSFKDGDTLYVKGSGAALAEVRPESFVRMDRRALGRIWEKAYPPDPDERETLVLADLMAARKSGEEGKRPSVETLLHDALPFAYVVHTHPALVNGLTCSREGEAAASELFPQALWIPSVNPGYILSLAVKNAMDGHTAGKGRPASVILLQNHGIFVGAGGVAEVKEIYRTVMEKIAVKIKEKPDLSGGLTRYGASGEIAALFAELAEKSAGPPGGPWQVSFLRNPAVAALTADRASFYPVSSAFSPDHIVYAGSCPLFVETGGSEAVFAGIRTAWENHLGRTGRVPKIAAVQGAGIFGIGPSEKAASLALEVFADAVKVAVYAKAFGGPRFMTRDQIDFIDNWEVERYRARIAVTEKTGPEGL